MAKKKPVKEPPAAEAAVAPESPTPAVCPYVKFTPKTLHRSELKNAPYNPRVMQDEARRDLKRNIERVGLLEGLIWNERSGNIVGGHQRIAILDTLMGTNDYTVPVCVVDMDARTEREQNIFLNNANSQGDWDLEKLGAMFKDEQVDVVNAGFTPAQMYQFFGDNPMVDQPEQLEVLASQMREARERYDKIKAACGKRDDMDYYLVVFASADDRAAFLDAVGLPQNRFVDGSALAGRVLKLTQPPPGSPPAPPPPGPAPTA